MSEEGNNDEDVGRLKEGLKEWIDHRIADNNAFISSPKKETLSLLFALFPPLGYLRLMDIGHSKYLDKSNLTCSWSTLWSQKVSESTPALCNLCWGSQPRNVLTRIPH